LSEQNPWASLSPTAGKFYLTGGMTMTERSFAKRFAVAVAGGSRANLSCFWSSSMTGRDRIITSGFALQHALPDIGDKAVADVKLVSGCLLELRSKFV
jgi:hypothetical protein